jgi:ParB/RepB/Spo0J family partition protein
VQIPPDLIRANPRNPRRDFPQKRIEALASSLDEVGMLVPLTVYEESGVDGKQYTLLDGERRLRAAKLNNWETVPAWITDMPNDAAANTLRMFNIHLMRDEWGDMPTTLALKDIMEATGIYDETELSRLTGLGRDMVVNMKRVLEFPQDWQNRVLNEDVPFNLLVELDKSILKKKKDAKKSAVLARLSDKKLRDFFLKGYDRGVVNNVVDLRNVGTLIDTAASSKNSERVRGRAQKAVDLLLSGQISIEDAFQYGAAASIGIKQVLRDVDNLPGRLKDVFASGIDDEDRDRLRTAMVALRNELAELIKRA